MAAFCRHCAGINAVKPTVIVGIGNPVLTDDGVGVHISRRLAVALADRTDVDVTEIYVGGMSLMETLVGYDRAIIIDAMESGHNPGAVYQLTNHDLVETKNSVCAHNTSLSAALDVGRLLNLPLPRSIEIWGIEPQDVRTFGEALTGAVAEAVPRVVDGILKTLKPS